MQQACGLLLPLTFVRLAISFPISCGISHSFSLHFNQEGPEEHIKGIGSLDQATELTPDQSSISREQQGPNSQQESPPNPCYTFPAHIEYFRGPRCNVLHQVGMTIKAMHGHFSSSQRRLPM
ncbi:MAG: hypothetical protein CL862_00680 [Cyanobium sp. NAT70]|nr:hypothetical protein [Cyanobium sp. NAT70]